MTMMVRARYTVLDSMWWSAITQSSRPCATLRMVRNSTAKVVTFTPPPVEPGAAPMNCSTLISSLVMGPQAARSMVFIPAVRVDTDWNSDAMILSSTLRPPMLAGLFHSIRPMRAAPPTHSNTEKISTTRAWRDSLRFLGYWISSTHTIKPRPPAMIINMTTAWT